MCKRFSAKSPSTLTGHVVRCSVRETLKNSKYDCFSVVKMCKNGFSALHHQANDDSGFGFDD